MKVDQVISFIKKLSLNIQSGFLVLIDIRFPHIICMSVTFFFSKSHSNISVFIWVIICWNSNIFFLLTCSKFWKWLVSKRSYQKYKYISRSHTYKAGDNNLGPDRLVGPKALYPNYCRQPFDYTTFVWKFMVMSCACLWANSLSQLSSINVMHLT